MIVNIKSLNITLPLFYLPTNIYNISLYKLNDISHYKGYNTLRSIWTNI